MKEMNWESLSKELQELLDYGGYEGTKAKVTVSGSGLDIKSATEEKTTFYHLESVADFCRCKRLSSYVTIIGEEIICRVY